jgi:ribosomal protein S12 methylthiotransferase accessory factor YcaO
MAAHSRPGGSDVKQPDARPREARLEAPAYALRLTQTQDATGYFMPVPQGDPGLDDVLAYLEHHPFDEFMHRYGLQQVLQLPSGNVRPLLDQARRNPILETLLLEAAHIRKDLDWLKARLPAEALADSRHRTPLVILRAETLPDRALHRQWIELLKENLLHHRRPAAAAEDWPTPCRDTAPPHTAVTLADVPPATPPPPAASAAPAFEAVCARALNALEALGVIEDEMRHESSLSPVALLRRWRLAVSVDQDRHHYRLSGRQTAYGKGLSLERARASCAMEIVERVSAFARVSHGRLPDTAAGIRLEQARLSELKKAGRPALDPNRLALEVPYEDQPLYWLSGEQAGGAALQVPFQTVYLFANLDEICLFSGLGSTGLAAGSTPAQARFHALLECVERDADAVQPFDPGQCFRLATGDAAVGGLLEAYRRRGIDVFFQDCSSGFGIPCYKCFVYGPEPEAIAKGTSAHFAGWQAALAALTETPYPFPHGPASRPGPQDLPIRFLETLPDYDSGNTDADLLRLETLLAAHGLAPVYVDLTRRDIGIPVVRALIPGLELMTDFDRYARVSERLFRNYRHLTAADRTPRR